jgi:hypothetical protein
LRHSTAASRLLAIATLVALVSATFGVSATAAARELSAGPLSDRGFRVAEAGNGPLSGSGTRGIVDPKRLPSRAQQSVQRPVKPFLSTSFAHATSPSAPQPAVASTAPDPVQVTSVVHPDADQGGVDGFSFGSGPDTSWQPPDPWIAVGPDHVIQTVNSSMQILDRNGTLIQSTSTADFFQLPPAFGNSDPRVIFDSLHQRWVMTELSWVCTGGGGFGYIDYLVSTTADPTDPWVLDYLEFEDYLPDYPAPGTSTVNIGFAANIFHMDTVSPDCLGAGSSYVGTDMLFADWSQVVRPPTATPPTEYGEFFLGPDAGFFTARIAVQAPATSATLFSVAQWDDPEDVPEVFVPAYFSFAGSVVGGTLAVTAANDLSADGVVAPWVEPTDPRQPGTTPVVTTKIDSRPTDAIWQVNKLTWVSNHGCQPTGDSGLQACVRVTQIDTSVVNSPSPRQDFLIADVDKDNYYGGIGQSLDGTLHVAWTRSSEAGTEYPSSWTAYHLPSEAANSLGQPEPLKTGVAGSFTGTRWGDYNGVAQDPQVPNAVWQAGMYSGGGTLWKTYVSQLQTGGSSYVPIAPLRVVNSKVPTGVSGIFSANVPRTFQVRGVGTIPLEAIAVTGNVTVVGQNQAGYVSVTATATATPTSSTINFPVGDVRANNFTLPLDANGKLAAVYKAAAGKTTHVIVDITGYFVAGNGAATYTTTKNTDATPAPTPYRVMDTRPAPSHVGPLNTFQDGVTQTLHVWGTGGPNGVPIGATAITGNLTVVGQTKAGYLSVTPDPPVGVINSSTLNFPVGDVRANGLTADLNATGDLSITYKTGAGGTANVILDVTGYYVDGTSGLSFYPLTPGRLLNTRSTAVLSGLAGVFSANNPRVLPAGGHWGIPATAEGLTGNLTVAGQTQAGYVSITPDPNPTPTTSTINFPFGDIRANGVTVPINGSGSIALVYKAGGGRTTDLILDVSGYFK